MTVKFVEAIPHLDAAFARDIFSDEIIDSRAEHSGHFEYGDIRLKREVRRILRNVVVDDENNPRLQISVTALSAIMNFHLLISELAEFQVVKLTCADHPTIQPGFTFLLKTSNMAVCKNSDNHLFICLPGMPANTKLFLSDLLLPSNQPPPESRIEVTSSYTFKTSNNAELKEELNSASMENAILFAKVGDLPRAIVHMAVAAVKQERSKLAGVFLEILVFDMPESLDALIEDAQDSEGEELGHLVIHRDRSYTLDHSTRIANILVRSRGIRDIGVEMSSYLVLKHRVRGYKLSVEVVRQGEERRVIKATLKTPLAVLSSIVRSVTGINIMGSGVTRIARNKHEIDQDQVAHSLLKGHFGKPGFKWIMGAILSNKVGIDERSTAITYLPRSKLILDRGSLLVNEPLVDTAQNLTCITTGEAVLVDWGPELGAVKLKRDQESLIRGTEVARYLRRGEWKRCVLSRRHMAC